MGGGVGVTPGTASGWWRLSGVGWRMEASWNAWAGSGQTAESDYLGLIIKLMSTDLYSCSTFGYLQMGSILCSNCICLWLLDQKMLNVTKWNMKTSFSARDFQKEAGRRDSRGIWGLFPEADGIQFLWHNRSAACCCQQQGQICFW